MMHNDSIRLFVGPMSKEIVDAVITFAHESGTPIGLIPSRRQIEYSGGYVNDWTSKEFVEYVRSQSSSVVLVRDHAGPGQGQLPDNGIRSLKEDIACGFDIIHIDPWKQASSLEGGIEQTVNLISYCCELNQAVQFEIGTEAAIYPYSSADLRRIIEEVRSRLGERFDRVKYAVVQSGVQISGTENIGEFNPVRLEEMTSICHEFGLISKEHNGDYLSTDEILQRVQLGLGCINIAPEFGVMQTNAIIDMMTPGQLEEAYLICEGAKKYEKWLPENFRANPPKQMIVELSGHYAFTNEPFASLIRELNITLASALYSRFNEIIHCWQI